MKRSFIVLISLLFASSAVAAGGGVDDRKSYPAFQLGVSGAWVSIEPGHIVKVDRVDQETPSQDRLKPGDLILEVNDRATKVDDPRQPLGQAITEAEAVDGRLRFMIERGGKSQDVMVKIPVIGAYSENWPLNCTKSKRIIAKAASQLAESQNEHGYFGDARGGSLTQCMAALFLLSTDNPAYDAHLQRFASALSQQKPSASTWHLGYQVIFLSEYYLKTGDKRVLPTIEAGCKLAADNQSAGAWGHSMNNVSVGYVQSGLMNSAGVTMFLGMTLARECGITVHEEAYQRSLKFFYRNIGHGSICYGDHRAEIYADTNGRNAAIACAMRVLDEEPFTTAGQHLAMMVADSYFAHEFGHTGGGFNMLWRGIVMPLLPESKQALVREHMEQLSWYYDLARLPVGGFSLLPSPPDTTRYVGQEWGHGLGLTYTAPLKTLRITGGPKTQHSKRAPRIAANLWGSPRDKVFLSTEHAPGYGQETDLPHEIYNNLTGREPVTAEYSAKMMRHFNPVIRTFAAHKLGALKTDAAYDQIDAALKDPDPRVRRAGCDAISKYENWGRGSTSGIPVDVVSERFVPQLVKMLADRDAAWWEIDGALWAMRAAAPEDIRRNIKLIDRFRDHEEWYLRESATWALTALGKDITGKEFLLFADQYNRASHVFERSSIDGAINHLLRRERIDLEPEAIAAFIRKIATQLYDAAIVMGYDEMAARHEAAHRTMMVLNRFKNPPYELIARDLAKYMAGWEPGNQHSNWLITGNKWQPGLVKIAKEMGKDAGPIIEQFERCLKKDYWDLKPSKRNPQPAIRVAMQQSVDEYKALR
jgi:hypothetical protein